MKVDKASFVAGAQTLESLPAATLPEVALIGRSNVGKSTLVNKLTGQKKLARTSDTPGRTQQLNFFDVRLSSKESGKVALHLVDLPGFGFAKLQKGRREEISEITVGYLRESEALKIVCLLNDVRRDPEEDERAIRDLAFETDRSLIVVLTKADKLSKNELKSQTKRIAESYGLEGPDLIVTGEGIPVDPLWRRITTLLALGV